MNKQEYEERLNRLQKELDELKKVEIKDDTFPRINDNYYFVNDNGCIGWSYWSGYRVDNYRKDFLRIFRTQEECERYLEIHKAFKDARFEPDWEDCEQEKWIIYYDNQSDEIRSSCYSSTQFASQYYFSSEETIDYLVERFGEDDIKKYIFGIED